VNLVLDCLLSNVSALENELDSDFLWSFSTGRRVRSGRDAVGMMFCASPFANIENELACFAAHTSYDEDEGVKVTAAIVSCTALCNINRGILRIRSFQLDLLLPSKLQS